MSRLGKFFANALGRAIKVLVVAFEVSGIALPRGLKDSLVRRRWNYESSRIEQTAEAKSASVSSTQPFSESMQKTTVLSCSGDPMLVLSGHLLEFC